MEVNPPGYRQSDVGVIPGDWVVRPVGQMGEIRSGKALAANAPGERRPYLRTTNVLDGSIVLDGVLWMPMTDAEFTRFQLLPNDVLLNEGQTTELVGRCSLYTGEYGGPCAMQNQLLRFRARRGVSARFAAHLFRQCQKNGVFAGIATQTTSVAHLGLKRFEGLKLAWPRVEAEQEAIAEALSDADDLIESLEQLIAKKRLIKHGVMQELLTGKRRLPGFETKPGFKKTGLGQLPVDWDVKPIGGLFSIQLGKMLDAQKNVGEPKPFLGNRAVQWGRVDIGGIGLMKMTPADQQRYRLRDGDLLACEGGEVGRCAVWSAQLPECFYQKAIHRLRPRANCSTRFLFYVLDLHARRGVFDSYTTGTGIAHLPKDKFETVPMPYPPAAGEREAIVGLLSDIDDELDALDARLVKARQLKQGMMQQLLTGRIRLV